MDLQDPNQISHDDLQNARQELHTRAAKIKGLLESDQFADDKMMIGILVCALIWTGLAFWLGGAAVGFITGTLFGMTILLMAVIGEHWKALNAKIAFISAMLEPRAVHDMAAVHAHARTSSDTD